jgi:hypothetical protein
MPRMVLLCSVLQHGRQSELPPYLPSATVSRYSQIDDFRYMHPVVFRRKPGWHYRDSGCGMGEITTSNHRSTKLDVDERCQASSPPMVEKPIACARTRARSGARARRRARTHGHMLVGVHGLFELMDFGMHAFFLSCTYFTAPPPYPPSLGD